MSKTDHPFITHPHRTLINLSIPVLISMTAEPITGLVDSGFISSLGVNPLAALGVGTSALSLLLWVFNFLGIGTQTEVAQHYGKNQTEEIKKVFSLASILALGFGILLILILVPSANWLARISGASGSVQANAVRYMQIRLYGAPAVLLTLVSFGALRGVQNMRTPMGIALGVNLLNIFLDWLLIFGQGPLPALGIGGSALASTISQWLGALFGIVLTSRKIGLSKEIRIHDAIKLLRVGGDLFIRTGVLTLFLWLTTRVANRIGPEAGAAHQVIRQVWVFTALALDAYASTVQSLVGYFIGQDSFKGIMRAVRVSLTWSISTGFLLGGLLWWGKDLVVRLYNLQSLLIVFIPAWGIFSICQPINAVAFLTDGVHWGTGDYLYLRNAMLVASGVGITGLLMLEKSNDPSLLWVWIITGIWTIFRGGFGLLRIWPGIGKSIFRS